MEKYKNNIFKIKIINFFFKLKKIFSFNFLRKKKNSDIKENNKSTDDIYPMW